MHIRSDLSLPLVFYREHLLKHLPLIMVLILSLSVRLGASFVMTDLNAPPEGDENVFISIAKNLVQGNGYSINGEIPTARRAPGYAFLLAGVFSIFGEDRVAARVTNILISTLTVGIIYALSYKLFFHKTMALVAALLSAFHLAFIQFSLNIISDTLFVFLITGSLFIFIKIHDYPHSVRLKLICGAILGVAILTRSEQLLFIPFIFIWAFLFYRQISTALRTFFIILLPILIFLLPWLIRNYIVFDGFVMATNLGRVMWGVHNPETFTNLDLMGGWHPPELGIRNEGDFPREGRDPAYRYLPEREWDQQQVRAAWEAIQHNVEVLPRLVIYKLEYLIFTSGAVRNLIRLPLLYFFIFGLILLLVSGDKRFLIFYMLLLSGGVFTTLIFYTNERLRMMIDPALIIIATYGLFEQIKLIKQRLHPA